MAQNDDAKRANTVLTIAQLKFKQVLKKEDHEARLPPVALDASSQFFSNIDAVFKQNTRVNVQKCTEWIVKHIAPSRSRIPVLGDYLVAVSKSLFVNQPAAGAAAAAAAAVAAAKKAARNRFDLLLIVNDVLHTDTFHSRSAAKKGIFGQECAAFTAELVAQAAACCFGKTLLVEKKLKGLLNYWAVNQLLSVEDLKTCRDRAEESSLLAQGITPVRKRHYLLPDYHGDRTAPWSELPASYMLEQMIREPQRPIDPNRIRVAKLNKKPVTPHVRKLLDNFFENIDLKFMPTGDNPTGETDKYKLWLDPLGQTVKQDKITGETAVVCNGYGWSRNFCQDMQKHGVPQNIKTAREDLERMEEVQESREIPRRQRDDRRRTNSPRRRRDSSSESDRRQSRNRDRRGGRSGIDGHDSRSPSRSRERRRGSRHRSSKSRDRYPDNRGRDHDDRRSDPPRPPSMPYGWNSAQDGSQWNGANIPPPPPPPPNGPLGNFVPPPPSSYGQSYSQSPQPPFSAPHFPPHPPVPGMYGGKFPVPPFLPPAPQQFQGPGGYVPPPPPPNFSGPYIPPPPMPTQQNATFMNNQFGNQEDVEDTETDLEAVVTTKTEEGIMAVNGDSVVEGIETRGKEE
ncbi:hypothetical protein J1614_000756 [Plenodomus biglobosus]|nr:hypothetical protein J1614_000756 [Plenodomus biglobosus]